MIVVAHNFKGYDGYFILEELYKQHVTNLSQVVNGAKILSVDIPNAKFIDSMNFFPIALSNFPKTFGIRELKKGFFPISLTPKKIRNMSVTCQTSHTMIQMVCLRRAKKNFSCGTMRKYLKGTFLIINMNF